MSDCEEDYSCGSEMEISEDEEDNGDYEDDHKHDDGLSSSYQVLSSEKISPLMKEKLINVMEIIRVSVTEARILMHNFKWNEDNLIQAYYDSEGKHGEFFEKYNLCDPAKACIPRQSTESCYCDICFNEGKMYTNTCGHKYCLNCWKMYLKVKIVESNEHSVTCQAYKCNISIDDGLINDVIKNDTNLLDRFNLNRARSFVESSTNLRNCPFTDCTYIAKIDYPSPTKIECRCNNDFCFLCLQEWHEPIDCTMLKAWAKKCSDDSETANWLSVNTKICPSCKVSVNKDGGCYHMTCSRCRHEFCWICLGAWQPHGNSYYKCNKYVEDENAGSTSREQLKRYLHYYSRYANHQQSIRLQDKLKSTVAQASAGMQTNGMSYIEVQFLNQALLALYRCRKTLMYSYAFAFYLEKNNEALIFEDNQADLESAVENLGSLLENMDSSEESLNAESFKIKIQDKKAYVEQRRLKLIDHIEEGRKKNIWEFKDKSKTASF
uniref:RBR-type E3 ubiquitin transferase n=1 Tax=Rhabditophanes sp. KR3021 TaxID=114890 RepID=A0AC35TT92_9BILA